ncbi:hypothetical protein, partial [Pseudomonas aeruginosa]|uniref:hypothetical protein n=1 Tax=Pseudomonas aeruginosa TaxID=287 RepID=UPI00223838C4
FMGLSSAGYQAGYFTRFSKLNSEFPLTSLNTLSKRAMTSPGVLHMSLIFRKIKDSEISRGGFELSDSMKYFGCMVVINMAGRTVLGPSPLIFTQERTSE